MHVISIHTSMRMSINMSVHMSMHRRGTSTRTAMAAPSLENHAAGLWLSKTSADADGMALRSRLKLSRREREWLDSRPDRERVLRDMDERYARFVHGFIRKLRLLQADGALGPPSSHAPPTSVATRSTSAEHVPLTPLQRIRDQALMPLTHVHTHVYTQAHRPRLCAQALLPSAMRLVDAALDAPDTRRTRQHDGRAFFLKDRAGVRADVWKVPQGSAPSRPFRCHPS